MKGRVVFRALTLVAVVAALVILQWRLDIFSVFTSSRVEGWLRRFGIAAPLVYMLVMALAIVVPPLPSLPLDIVAGAFFGPLLGTLYSAVGALAGAVVSFLIARFFGSIGSLLRGHINFCVHCSNKILTWIVFLSRLVPVVSFDVVSYGAGLTVMSLGMFSLATFLGMLPLTFVYNYFGSVLVIRGWVSTLIAVLFVLLFFLLPHLVERHDFLHLKRFLTHEPETAASDTTSAVRRDARF